MKGSFVRIFCVGPMVFRLVSIVTKLVLNGTDVVG